MHSQGFSTLLVMENCISRYNIKRIAVNYNSLSNSLADSN